MRLCLTPPPLRKTRHITYARATPPTAQRGPLQRVSGLGVDVHDHRLRHRCNSEKHLSQLVDRRQTAAAGDNGQKRDVARGAAQDGVVVGRQHLLEGRQDEVGTAPASARRGSRRSC